MKRITHSVPYLPSGRELYEVPASDQFMAQAMSEVHAMERENPEANRAAASVVVKDGKVIGIGRNHSVHQTFCPRKALGIPTGQGYELCPSYCHSNNHSESAAIATAQASGADAQGADLYLAGHWWACEPCWSVMISAGIRNVFVAEGAKVAFDDAARKDNPLAGRLKRPIALCVIGDDAKVACEALARVGFLASERLSGCEAILLLYGAPDGAPDVTIPVYDYRAIPDYRLAITRLSEELKL